jgi:8-oxo-dGTP diphosphatase
VGELTRTYPARPWVGVGVIVWRDGKVLSARRARPPRLGEWSIPGGAQQVGETVAQAAEREIFEETGLTVRAAELVSVEDAVTRDADGAVLYHYTIIEIAADWQAGEATAADDVDAVVWATPAETDALLEKNPAARRVLRRAAQLRGFDVKETS